MYNVYKKYNLPAILKRNSSGCNQKKKKKKIEEPKFDDSQDFTSVGGRHTDRLAIRRVSYSSTGYGRNKYVMVKSGTTVRTVTRDTYFSQNTVIQEAKKLSSCRSVGDEPVKTSIKRVYACGNRNRRALSWTDSRVVVIKRFPQFPLHAPALGPETAVLVRHRFSRHSSS
jgi:hypothetical protein